MKNLKKKFGKFAISTAQVQQIKGGNPNCAFYSCLRGSANYFEVPTGLEAECCSGR